MIDRMSRHTFLKMKLVSLAAEARLIRREEQRWPGEHPIPYGLHEHRILVVRREARSTCLTPTISCARGHTAPWRRHATGSLTGNE